jgi:outer membrane protein TolC
LKAAGRKEAEDLLTNSNDSKDLSNPETRKKEVKIMVFARLVFMSFVFLGFLGIQSPLWSQETRPAPLKLSDLIEEAVSKNPDIIAAKSKWEVTRERPLQAGSLDDPMIGLGIINLPTNNFSFRTEDMTQKEISITQRFPYPGKRSLRVEAAEKEAEAGLWDYEEIKIKISRDLKAAYHELAFVNKAIGVTEKNREILKLLNKIAETKYSLGEGIQLDLLKSQVDLSKMLGELITLNQTKRSLKSRLNTLLQRPPFAPLGEPEEMALVKISSEPEELLKEAEEKRPMLQSAKRMIEKNKAGLRAAEKDYYPDFEVKFSYGQRDDGPNGRRSDMVSAMVGFNIPFWYKSKQAKRVSESQKEIQSAQDQYHALANEIRYLVSEKLTEIERTEEQIVLLKTGIIPQATLALDSALQAYRVNKVDYLTLLDNLMTLFRYEIQFYRLLADQRKSVVEIEGALGRSLPEEKKG